MATRFLQAAWLKRDSAPEEFKQYYTNVAQAELERELGLSE